MRNTPFITLILFTLLLTSVAADGTIVYHLNNNVLASKEVFIDNFSLEPYAPHSIESEINTTDQSTSEAIVVITISSEMGGGKIILIYGSHPNTNTTFTPGVALYEIKMENNVAETVEVSITIRQTGQPSTDAFASGNLLMAIVIPLSIIIGLPVIITTSALFIYRNRHMNHANPSNVDLVYTSE